MNNLKTISSNKAHWYVKHANCVFLGLFFFCLLPDTAHAFNSLQVFTQPGDQSKHFLEIIFGRVGDVLQGNDKILGRLFNLLNSAILFISSIVLSYTTLTSVINTAREGQVLGKKGWSITWIPLRAFIGIAIILPGVSGYSIIQEFMMTVVLEGIGAANGVWQSGLKVVQRSGSLNNVSLDKNDVPETIGLSKLVEDLLGAEMCRQKLAREFTAKQELIDSGNAVATSIPKEFYNPDLKPIIRVNEDNPVYFFIGNTYKNPKTSDNNLCGTIQAPSDLSPENRLIHLKAAMEVMEYLGPFAETLLDRKLPSLAKPALTNARQIYDNAIAVTRASQGVQGTKDPITMGSSSASNIQFGSPGTVNIYGIDASNATSTVSSGINTGVNKTIDTYNTAANAVQYGADELKDFFKSASDSVSGIKKEIFTNAVNDGWIFAGSYYYKLVKPMQILTPLTASTYTAPPAPDYTSTEGTSTNVSFLMEEPYKSLVDTYIDKLQEFTSTTGAANIKMSPIGSTSFPKKGGLQKIFDASLGKVSKNLTELIVKNLTNKSSDPLNSLQKWGQGMVMAAEIVWLASIPIVIATMMATAGAPYNPLTNALKIVYKVLFPLMTAVITILWAMGAMLAIYVPLIPYIVFTMGAVAWMIMVIESMVAIPIVALGIVAPSKDKFDSAEPAMKIIFGVFLRPSLMVIGFFVGARLMVAAIEMINFGFLTTLSSAVPSISLFGPFAVVMIYTGMVLAVINKCFSLIHILPDKIIRWIGGTPEHTGSSVAQDAQAVKGWAEKGIAGGEALGTAGIKYATEQLKEREENANKNATHDKRVDDIQKKAVQAELKHGSSLNKSVKKDSDLNKLVESKWKKMDEIHTDFNSNKGKDSLKDMDRDYKRINNFLSDVQKDIRALEARLNEKGLSDNGKKLLSHLRDVEKDCESRKTNMKIDLDAKQPKV